MKNRTIPINRGKVLGGSSALNLLVWNRAAAPEYDAWEAVGNHGWNWKSMHRAMKRSENFTGPTNAAHGYSGPVHAVVNRYIPQHQEFFIPTVSTLGIPINEESLGGDAIGVMYQPSSIDPTHYNRSYSANAYIPLAGANLDVLTDTRVLKINFHKTGRSKEPRAIGVILETGESILAHREVILSAGAVQSPGLLELSGIGQQDVLSAANISTLIDLPGVGENLQDHIRVQLSYQLKDNYTSYDILKYDSAVTQAELVKWFNGDLSWFDYTGSGFIITDWKKVVGNDSKLISLAKAAFGSSSNVHDKEKLAFLENPAVPQLEVIFSDGYTGLKGYPAPGTSLFGKGFFTLIAVLLHPFSRGSVHINPADKLGKPLLNPNYLSNEYDVQSFVESLKFCRKVALTEPLRSAWVSEYEPGLENVQSDEQWRDFALNTTFSIQHPMSTCAMGARDSGGVVDARLKVYGTANLRVVDASVIPLQISGHIQTAVYGIAERAAEMIIDDARK